MKNNKLVKDALGWGFILWLFGYVLGIVLFFALPPTVIGWVILPAGLLITIWVLLKRVNDHSLADYVVIASTWTAIAIIFDYVFIVKAFKPSDGYYKLDVYVYYILTFAMPLIAGFTRKTKAGQHAA